jgi:two-component system OmpR family response regulator
MTTSVSPHVLVIDDDPSVTQMLADYLGINDFRVTTGRTGADLTRILADHVVDLVMLDLRLAGEDGMLLARKLREESSIPIIIITGNRDDADRIMGLELAADDYVTKPFNVRELLARIRAVLRRYQTARDLLPARDATLRAYRFAGWELNLRTRKLVSPDGARIDLTIGEFNLLRAFCAAPQRVLTREQLLDLSRLHGAEVYDRSIDVQILRLRRKIEPEPTHPRYIRTERGSGYLFDVAVDTVH